MNYEICMTGVTSFSGSWFCEELLKNNFNVIGVHSGNKNESVNKRLSILKSYGNQFKLIKYDEINKLNRRVELVLLHGTATFDYRSSDFDVNLALKSTVDISEKVLKQLRPRFILHTGTFSEPFESIGESPLVTFNGYSYSKKLIWDQHKLMATNLNSKIFKYVMPNPFGPRENPKFTDYLIKTWASDKIPVVQTPDYIRDNVPIDLLAQHYVAFTKRIINNQVEAGSKIQPSLYVESVWTFANRYLNWINALNKSNFKIERVKKHDFKEPRIRVNGDLCTNLVPEWDETGSWKIVADDVKERVSNIKKN